MEVLVAREHTCKWVAEFRGFNWSISLMIFWLVADFYCEIIVDLIFKINETKTLMLY